MYQTTEKIGYLTQQIEDYEKMISQMKEELQSLLIPSPARFSPANPPTPGDHCYVVMHMMDFPSSIETCVYHSTDTYLNLALLCGCLFSATEAGYKEAINERDNRGKITSLRCDSSHKFTLDNPPKTGERVNIAWINKSLTSSFVSTTYTPDNDLLNIFLTLGRIFEDSDEGKEECNILINKPVFPILGAMVTSPNQGDVYYTVQNNKVASKTWDNREFDWIRFEEGLVFKLNFMGYLSACIYSQQESPGSA